MQAFIFLVFVSLVIQVWTVTEPVSIAKRNSNMRLTGVQRPLKFLPASRKPSVILHFRMVGRSRM